MKRLFWTAMAGLCLALLPTSTQAQEPKNNDSFLLRIDGDITVGRDDRVETLVVIDGNATIAGTVKDVVLIDSTLTVTGRVTGTITAIDGAVNLESGSRVNDVALIDGTLNQANGATVDGSVDEQADLAFDGALGVLGLFFQLSMGVAFIVAGLLFAAIGGRQLTRAAMSLTEEPGQTILAALILWIGLPILGVIIIFTVIGVLLGLGVLLFLLPALWFLGYLVFATRVGAWLTGLAKRPIGEHPYLAVLVGVVVLQILGFVPVIGWLVIILGALWGAGALALIAWRAMRGSPVPLAPATSEPAMP